MTPADIHALEQAALAATQGPWRFIERSRGDGKPSKDKAALPELVNDAGNSVCWFGYDLQYDNQAGNEPSAADQAFMAAANPSAVLELVRRLREAEAALGWLADCRIASGDNGKRMLTEFVEYLRELKTNSDQIGELQEALRTCHLKMAHRALQFRKQLEQLKEARIGEARYEKLRKLNAQQFAELYQRNIKGEGRFDDLVDGL